MLAACQSYLELGIRCTSLHVLANFQDGQKCVHAANMSCKFRWHFVVSLVSRLLTLRQSVKADMHGYSASLYL